MKKILFKITTLMLILLSGFLAACSGAPTTTFKLPFTAGDNKYEQAKYDVVLLNKDIDESSADYESSITARGNFIITTEAKDNVFVTTQSLSINYIDNGYIDTMVSTVTFNAVLVPISSEKTMTFAPRTIKQEGEEDLIINNSYTISAVYGEKYIESKLIMNDKTTEDKVKKNKAGSYDNEMFFLAIRSITQMTNKYSASLSYFNAFERVYYGKDKMFNAFAKHSIQAVAAEDLSKIELKKETYKKYLDATYSAEENPKIDAIKVTTNLTSSGGNGSPHTIYLAKDGFKYGTYTTHTVNSVMLRYETYQYETYSNTFDVNFKMIYTLSDFTHQKSAI